MGFEIGAPFPHARTRNRVVGQGVFRERNELTMAKKRRIRRPSDTAELWGEFNEVFESLSEESPRGAVVIAASYIDESLRFLLESGMIQNKTICKKLFEYPGPLSSFAARVDLAYALGLISPVAYRNIGHIRTMRNLAAHSYRTTGGENEALTEEAMKLELPTELPLPRCDDPANRFLYAVMLTLPQIGNKTAMQKRPQPASDMKLIDVVRL